MEIYYRRAETVHKGKTIPARVETVVLFLPDVWNCLPTRLEWDGLQANYKKLLDRKLNADQDMADDGDAADEKATAFFDCSLIISFSVFYLFFTRNRLDFSYLILDWI